MPSLNKVYLLGNLTRDPEVRQLPGGQPDAQADPALAAATRASLLGEGHGGPLDRGLAAVRVRRAGRGATGPTYLNCVQSTVHRPPVYCTE